MHRYFRTIFRHLLVIGAAVGLTLLFFLLLPLIQTLTRPPDTDLIVQSIDTANLPPPPPPPEEEEEKPEEEKKPEEPPELTEEAPPLDLSQLELALNPGFGEGSLAGDFAVKLNTIAAASGSDVDSLFSMSDLDQQPRVIYQPGPALSRQVMQKAPGTVYVIFIVERNGRVENPIVQKSTDPIFEQPALNAVRQWKFEPGKRNGQAVRFRMRVPITFPKS